MTDWILLAAVAAVLMGVSFLVGWRSCTVRSPDVASSLAGLRSVITRLDVAAQEVRSAADKLKLNAEIAERLAEIHRMTLDQIVGLLRQLQLSTAASSATGLRIEAQAEQVASDLEASHHRAESVKNNNHHGAAADAFASKPRPE
jgi:type II secretory pathway component PulM